MRTLAAIVVTSVLTALAVHVVDAKAADVTVEAQRFVIRDANGAVRVAIDAQGVSVVDDAGRERAGIRVEADQEGRFGQARVFVTPVGGSLAFAELNDGVFADPAGGGRLAHPRVESWFSPAFALPYGLPSGSASLVPGQVRLDAGSVSGSSPTTLSAERGSLVVTAPGGRVRRLR